MTIDREMRNAARWPRNDPLECPVAVDDQDPVHSDQKEENIVSMCGVVVRNSKSVGKQAIETARSFLNGLKCEKIARPETKIDAGEEWFKDNQGRVEKMLGYRISINKQQCINHVPIRESTVPETFNNYQPVIDNDAEVYVPKSQR